MALGELAGKTIPIRRRPWWTKISGAHVAMVLVAIVAFLLNLSLLRDDTLVQVAVARTDLPAGSIIGPDSVSWVEVNGDSELVTNLITRDRLGEFEGQVVSGGLTAGDALIVSLIRRPAAPSDLRAFTIPVGQNRAGGGSLIRGDVVDVISTVDGIASYVATGAEVLSVPSGERRGITSTNGYFVVIGVDADTALALAEAIENGAIDVVRATGAPDPERLTLTRPQEVVP